MNEIITSHPIFAGSLRRAKEECFGGFESSTTFFDICINVDDIEMIEIKTSIIFKSFEMEIVVFVAESVKNFADVIIQIKFEKIVLFKNLFVFRFQTLKRRRNPTEIKRKLRVLIIIKTMKKIAKKKKQTKKKIYK